MVELKKLTKAVFRGTHGIYAGCEFLVNPTHIVRIYPEKTGKGYDDRGDTYYVIELVNGKTISIMEKMENWSYSE
jgi:hypothetical protein